jgi:hypothetical protein
MRRRLYRRDGMRQSRSTGLQFLQLEARFGMLSQIGLDLFFLLLCEGVESVKGK